MGEREGPHRARHAAQVDDDDLVVARAEVLVARQLVSRVPDGAVGVLQVGEVDALAHEHLVRVRAWLRVRVRVRVRVRLRVIGLSRMCTSPWWSTHTHEASRSMAAPPGSRSSQPRPTAMMGCAMGSVSCRCRQSAWRVAIEALMCSSPLALEQPLQLLTACHRSLTWPPVRLARGMRTWV
jgi:hypothetical protein